MVDLKPPFTQYLGRLPADVRKIHSMISSDERSFLYHIARDRFTGEGIIVDGGIFLGASTFSFAKGVQDNPRRAAILERTVKPVVSLDRAIATASLVDTIQRSGSGNNMVAGDSFEPMIRDNISAVQDLVDLRIGDILELGLVDGPIEILFLDVLKTPEISAFAMINYFTKLIPGRSIVIQQDYFIDGLYFIRAHQEALGSKFEYIGELAASGVFLCKEAITEDDVRKVLKEGTSLEKILHHLDAACDRTKDPLRRILMMVSQVRLLAQRRQLPAALEGMAQIETLVSSLGEDTFPTRVARSLAGVRHICATGGSRASLSQWYQTIAHPARKVPERSATA